MIETSAPTVTYLFSDIEGSTKLWEVDRDCAARTVAWHDEISRSAVERHRGTVVKTTGDGLHAVFDDPADAVASVIDLQLALAEPAGSRAPLKVRCGLHLGADQRRDNDFFGPAVNRAARIMSAAHGGQVLVSGAVADLVAGRLPQDVMLRDLGAVRLRDLGSPEHVYQVIHPGLRREFPPLRSMASTPNNLAQQLNSFIGRDRDMAQVQQLLANSRLLTLLGMGGLGKSRLSVQVAAVVLDNYPDGVWFVELAALSDPRLVPQALASVLGVKEEPDGTVMDAVARFVRDKQLLVVLDNCEHVVEACAELAKRLLEVGPKVKVLASSRDSLRISGENVFQVSPLPLPDAGANPSVKALLDIDSVKLFVDRAMAVQPAFRLSEESAPAVTEICRRLDGIPLGIELAAARVRAMSAEAISMRLDNRFRLLNRGDRTASPRQQTLRAMIDWSHDLLDAKEQALFRRLAVFAGGWTLEAAEAVGAERNDERDEILDLLSNLVEKSLVFVEVGSGRYGMLDTVRQYAQEKLAGSGEGESTRGRHLAFFLNFVEGSRPRPEHVRDHDVGQPSTLLAMDIELEDIRAAWLHAVQLRDGEAVQAMAPPLARYFGIRGRTVEGIALLDQAAGAWSDRQASAGAVVQQALASLFHRSGDLDRAEAAVRTAIRLQRAFRHGGATQPSLYLLGAILYTRGEFAAAKRYFEHALRVAQAAPDTAGTAKALNGLAGCARAAGDYSRALELQRQALQLHESLGNVHEQALLLNDIGVMLFTSRRYGGACQVLQRGLALTAAHGLDGAREYCLFTLGMTEIELERFDDARGHLRQSLQIDRAAGAGLVAWGAHLGLARADIRTGAATTASTPLGEGVKRARALKSVQAQIYALGFIAEWLAARSEPERAAALWSFIVAHPRAEAADRDDARMAIDGLRLTATQKQRANGAAGAFELDSLIDALAHEIAG